MGNLDFHKFQFEVIIEILQSRRFLLDLTREELKDIDRVLKYIKKFYKRKDLLIWLIDLLISLLFG